MGRGEALGSDLLREHRRLVEKVAAAIEPDQDGDLILADLRELWQLGDEWEKAGNRLADLLTEATELIPATSREAWLAEREAA